MAEKNYIYKIFEDKLMRTMEHDFEKDYPFVKCFLKNDNPIFKKISMKIFDRDEMYIATFAITEFDCARVNEEVAEDDKSLILVDDKDIKRWYVRWMKNHFDTYKNDYIANINKIANEDLGV